MRKIFNTISLLFSLCIVTTLTQSCNNTSTDKPINETEVQFESDELAEVKAYYFHATRRCATCQAVEDVSKEAIAEYYGKKVIFESINRDEEKENPLLAKYKVNGQTLLIINGNKKVDLTNDAFLYARTNPDKLKSKLKSTIDSMM